MLIPFLSLNRTVISPVHIRASGQGLVQQGDKGDIRLLVRNLFFRGFLATPMKQELARRATLENIVV